MLVSADYPAHGAPVHGVIDPSTGAEDGSEFDVSCFRHAHDVTALTHDYAIPVSPAGKA